MSYFRKFWIFWQKVRKNWKIKYHLLIRADETQRDVFSLLLSPRNIFVVTTLAAVLLIMLTALLIAFTPLGIYVTRYKTPDEYWHYRETAQKVDSMELIAEQNRQYFENLSRILNDIVLPNELDSPAATPQEVATAEPLSLKNHTEAELALRQETADLLQTIANKQANTEITIDKRAGIEKLFLQPPTTGTIIGYYNVPQNQYGLDIANVPGTLITSAADGMVIFAGYTATDGNVLMIQHHDNVISIYKNNQNLLKTVGAKVATGEPIAEMGHSGITNKGTHLHFELWHNGFPINPLDYLSLK